MALQITETYGVTKLFGTLNSQNMKSLMCHLKEILKEKEILTLSLDNIDRIDNSAALQLEEMYRRAPKEDRVFTLVGKENKLIAAVLKATNTDYILSDDRI